MSEFLLHIAWLALSMSGMILAVLVFMKLFGKRFSAKSRYAVWAVVIVSMCVATALFRLPTLFTLQLPMPSAAVETSAETEEHFTPVDTSAVTDARPPSTAQPPVSEKPPVVETPPSASVPTVPAVTDTESAPSTPDTEIPSTTPEMPVQDTLTASVHVILFCIWAAGAILLFAVSVAVYIRSTHRYARGKKLCAPETEEMFCAMCRRYKVRRIPQLYVCAEIGSPVLYGYTRPTVLLPDIPLSQNALVGVLAHELTHYRRGDIWIKLLCLVAESLFWFDPLMYVAAARCNAEMELSCDEAVLSGMAEDVRRSYGNVMLQIVKNCSRKRSLLTTQFNPHKSAVKERILNILDMTKKKRGRVIISVTLALCLLIGAVIGCAIGEASAGTLKDGVFTVDADVTIVDARTFGKTDTDSITTLVLSEAVETVDFAYLNTLPALQRITVAEGNAHYRTLTDHADANILLSLKTNEMLYIPAKDTNALSFGGHEALFARFAPGDEIRMYTCGAALSVYYDDTVYEDVHCWFLDSVSYASAKWEYGEKVTGNCSAYAFRLKDGFVFAQDWNGRPDAFIFQNGFGVAFHTDTDGMRFYLGEEGELLYTKTASLMTSIQTYEWFLEIFSPDQFWKEEGSVTVREEGLVYTPGKTYTVTDYFTQQGTTMEEVFEELQSKGLTGAYRDLAEMFSANMKATSSPTNAYAAIWSTVDFDAVQLPRPAEESFTVRDVFTDRFVSAMVGENGSYVFSDVDGDGVEEAVVTLPAPTSGYNGSRPVNTFEIYDVRDGKLLVCGRPHMTGSIGGEYDAQTRLFTFYCVNNGGVESAHLATFDGEFFYLPTWGLAERDGLSLTHTELDMLLKSSFDEIEAAGYPLLFSRIADGGTVLYAVSGYSGVYLQFSVNITGLRDWNDATLRTYLADVSPSKIRLETANVSLPHGLYVGMRAADTENIVDVWDDVYMSTENSLYYTAWDDGRNYRVTAAWAIPDAMFRAWSEGLPDDVEYYEEFIKLIEPFRADPVGTIVELTLEQIVSVSDVALQDKARAALAKGGDVILPEGLVKITSGYWDSDWESVETPITSITFPDSYVIQPRQIIARTVQNYYVSESNTRYTSIDGVIYTKDKKHIVAYPMGREGSFSIPDSVLYIDANAFACTKLHTVYVPDSVITIGPHAFNYAENLKSISLPKNIDAMEYFLPSVWVDNGVPNGINRLREDITVTYRGTYEAWQALYMPIDVPREQLICAPEAAEQKTSSDVIRSYMNLLPGYFHEPFAKGEMQAPDSIEGLIYEYCFYWRDELEGVVVDTESWQVRIDGDTFRAVAANLLGEDFRIEDYPRSGGRYDTASDTYITSYAKDYWGGDNYAIDFGVDLRVHEANGTLAVTANVGVHDDVNGVYIPYRPLVYTFRVLTQDGILYYQLIEIALAVSEDAPAGTYKYDVTLAGGERKTLYLTGSDPALYAETYTAQIDDTGVENRIVLHRREGGTGVYIEDAYVLNGTNGVILPMLSADEVIAKFVQIKNTHDAWIFTISGMEYRIEKAQFFAYSEDQIYDMPQLSLIRDYSVEAGTLTCSVGILCAGAGTGFAEERLYIRYGYDIMEGIVPFEIYIEARESILQTHGYTDMMRRTVSVGERTLTLGDYLEESEMRAELYAEVDIDGDGTEETVLWLARGTNTYAGFLVLQGGQEVARAHMLAYRALCNLKADGTFDFSGGVSDHGVGRMHFSGATYTVTELARSQSGAGTQITYYMEGKTVSKAAYEAYLATQSQKPDAAWYSFSWDGTGLQTEKTGPQAEAEAKESTAEEQLWLIASLADVWAVVEEADLCGYAVTDLNQNGRLEVISSVCQGSSFYSATRIFEVNATCDALEEYSDAFLDNDSQPDFLFFEEGKAFLVDGTYCLLLEDMIKDENAFQTFHYIHYAVSLQDGALVCSTLGGRTDIYRYIDDGTEMTSSFYDGEGNGISEQQYNSRIGDLYTGRQEYTVKIGWSDPVRLAAYSSAEIEEMLAHSYDMFAMIGVLSDKVSHSR